METINIHEAKTHLSKLVDRASKGEQFIIAKAGKPLVKVVAIDTTDHVKRLGFLAGEYTIPDDFNQMKQADIEELFESEE